MKKLLLILLIQFLNLKTISANPNYEKIVEDGIIKGMLIPLKATKKAFNEEIAEIETKDGKVKINTKDNESMKKAAEFRKNYIKPKQCNNIQSEQIQIECNNAFINARKEAINK